MAVGTGAISLSEVITEIPGVQTSLQDCIDDHIDSGLNPTYGVAPVTSLAEFRGYTQPVGATVTAIIMTTTGQTTRALANTEWNNVNRTTRYITGPNNVPTDFDDIYTDITGYNLYDGGGNYYADGTFTWLVTSVGNCRSVTFDPA